jgi:hypothetical protein
MPTVDEVLQQDQEPFPAWLHDTGTLDKDTINNFFLSRVVYYPGSGTDGRGFAVFGSSKSAHCFVHIDLTATAEAVATELQGDHPARLNGYQPVSQQLLNADALNRQLGLNRGNINAMSALWTVLERDSNCSHDGPGRFAFLHIQAEAIKCCRYLWGRKGHCPFAVLIHDHGSFLSPFRFGGRNSHLFPIAKQAGFPRYLLVAHGSHPWRGYEPASGWTNRLPGGHARNRLYRGQEADCK